MKDILPRNTTPGERSYLQQSYDPELHKLIGDEEMECQLQQTLKVYRRVKRNHELQKTHEERMRKVRGKKKRKIAQASRRRNRNR